MVSVRLPLLRDHTGTLPGSLCGKVLCTSCRARNALSWSVGRSSAITAPASRICFCWRVSVMVYKHVNMLTCSYAINCGHVVFFEKIVKRLGNQGLQTVPGLRLN